jgi:uncharacterized membrane protein
MLFLAILVLALAVAWLVPGRHGRQPLRDAARIAMGAAFVIAGASHFGTPDPFVQHLPEWVPAREGLVALTGVLEVLGGLALIGPRRLRVPMAAALAVYLVAVFPANIHVAVNAIDVDGQPGGPYAWLRLLLQPLFIWWVVASTPGATQVLRRVRLAPRTAAAQL